MISLPVTPQNDALAVFLVKIKKQGANVLLNGMFNDNSVWGADPSWVFTSGIIYNIDNDGVLSQTVAVESALYVFEYEITSKTGTGYQIKLDSSDADSVLTSDVFLDLTNGKHTVNILLSSLGSKFYISTVGFGTDDSVAFDNMALRKINDEIRASSKKTLVVGSDVYYEGLLFQDYSRVLGDISKQMDALAGGGIGNTENLQFGIVNFSQYFINSFAPNHGEPELTGAEVTVYVAWSNLTYTDENQLILINTYYINENTYYNNKMDFLAIEYSDLEQETIPRYSVQKDTNDGVSYYPNADQSTIGSAIPIVYGGFNVWNPVPVYATNTKVNFCLTPAILVNSANLEFIISSHQVKTDSWNQHGKTGVNTNLLFKYLSGLNTFMMISKNTDSASSYTNDASKYSFKFMYTISRMYGDLYALLSQVSQMDKSEDTSGAIDIDPLTYSTIPNFADPKSLLAVVADGKESTGDVGYLGAGANDILVVFGMKATDGININFRVGYKNWTLQTPPSNETVTQNGLAVFTEVAVIDLAQTVAAKKDTVLPWTIEEVCNLDYYVVNHSPTVGKTIDIHYGYIKMKNINVTGLTVKVRGHGWLAQPTVKGTGIKLIIRRPM